MRPFAKSKCGGRSRVSGSIRSGVSRQARQESPFSVVSMVSGPKRKHHCSSKSFSKSPNFDSLKKNLKFKTQKCRTSVKVKQAIQGLSNQQNRVLANDPRDQSQATFESQKVFSTVVPSVDIYFSPTRIRSLADPYFPNSKLNSSFKVKQEPSSIRHIVKIGQRKDKLHVSENLDKEPGNLANFKSLDQLKLPKNLLDCASFNSHQNANVGFFKKSRGPSKRNRNGAKKGDKYSFFKAYSTNKPRPCSWKKKNHLIPGKKMKALGGKLPKKMTQWTGNKNKPIKLGLFQKVHLTRPAKTKRTLLCSTHKTNEEKAPLKRKKQSPNESADKAGPK